MGTDRLAWFRDARFGLFIHWGVYALQRNGEWVMNADSISVADYHALAREFCAERLDVDAWARTAHEAGAEYMVLTTKHHDGFCLWDTRTTDFNAVKTGPRRDVVREFVDACRRHGLRVGLYWSWVDWNYPDWAARYVWTDLNQWRQPLTPPAAHERMVEYLHAQVRELLTQYGQIDILWFDGGFLTAEQYRSRELVDEMRRLQPGLLINDRAGFPGDFGNPEGLMPTAGSERAWELCHPSAAFTTWTAPLDDPALFAPPTELLGLLSDAAGLGGSFLLNIGPQADGAFPGPSQEQLRVIGDWLRANGEAIYGTQAGPTGRQEWGVSTQRAVASKVFPATCRQSGQRGQPGQTTQVATGRRVYLHVFRPAARLAVRGFSTPVRRARLLETGAEIAFPQDGTALALDLPPAQQLPQVVALELAEAPAFRPEPIRQRLDGSVILTANQADLRTAHADGKPAIFLSPDACGGRVLGWKRLEDRVEWTFHVDQPGRFRPAFEFNNPESLNVYGRRLAMTVAGQTLRASVPLSGRHGRYESYRMAGAFTLEPGVHRLTLSPYVLDPGILMNLRAVVLTPAPPA